MNSMRESPLVCYLHLKNINEVNSELTSFIYKTYQPFTG